MILLSFVEAVRFKMKSQEISSTSQFSEEIWVEFLKRRAFLERSILKLLGWSFCSAEFFRGGALKLVKIKLLPLSEETPTFCQIVFWISAYILNSTCLPNFLSNGKTINCSRSNKAHDTKYKLTNKTKFIRALDIRYESG